jgi:hypothetical protein
MAIVIPGEPGKAEPDAGIVTPISSCSAPWGGQVDAGTAAHHHSAGDDPCRGRRDDAYPQRRPATPFPGVNPWGAVEGCAR